MRKYFSFQRAKRRGNKKTGEEEKEARENVFSILDAP
jgi:hypothetical protein